MDNFAFVVCDYEEWDVDSYRGMIVMLDKREMRFYSNEPDEDIQKAVEYARRHVTSIGFSSMVENFVMDGGRLNMNRAMDLLQGRDNDKSAQIPA